MGSPISQVAPSTQPRGKSIGGNPSFAAPSTQTDQIDPTTTGVYNQPSNGQSFNQALGKGGSVTTPGQGGQPKMGQPNRYPNTVGQWDNASIQPRQTQSGKGKGY